MGWSVSAVGLQEGGIARIGQVQRENLLFNTTSDCGVAHGEDAFDTTEEVALHPIGTAEVEQRFATVGEAEDAAVLEEASEYAAHADGLALTWYAGNEAADAAHDKLDGHPGT